MASQQPPMRPWFRLPSMARPAPPPPQRPDPPAQPQPQPPVVALGPRLPFVQPTLLPLRPPTPPIQPPQEPVPPPPAAASPPISAQPPPPLPTPTANTSSVPTSPAPRSSPNSTTLPNPKISVPSSPTPPPPSPAPMKTLSNSPAPSPHSSPAPMKTVSNSPVAPPQPSPTPPPRSPLTAATTATVAAHSAPPSPPPQIIKQLAGTPSPSPKTKSISHPPSPLNLPPAQIRSDAQRETKIPVETEKKTVVVEETIGKPKLMTQNSNGDFQRTHNSNIAQKDKEITKEKGKHEKSSDSEDFGMRVITIAGDNKGAVMEFSPSNKKKGNPGTESDEFKMNEKTKNSTMSTPMKAFINSNVQGVNNSILFNSALTHHDPGIHLSLSRKKNGGGWGTPHKD